ncbi:hypothetical protein RB213_006643 [Colletotrichum asianum]
MFSFSSRRHRRFDSATRRIVGISSKRDRLDVPQWPWTLLWQMAKISGMPAGGGSCTQYVSLLFLSRQVQICLLFESQFFANDKNPTRTYSLPLTSQAGAM